MTAGIDRTVIAIRQEGAEALDVMMDIMACAFDRSYGEAWNRTQSAGMLGLPGVWLCIARTGGVPAGFALSRIVIDEAELLLIAVRPESRRRGIGESLMDETISVARNRGAKRLHLEVRQGNDAIKLYERLGFSAVGRRDRYYRGAFGQCFDALTLQRSISGNSGS